MGSYDIELRIMSVHPTLTLAVYIGAATLFTLVVAYWVTYTRRLKIPPRVGKQEGIAIPTQKKEQAGRTGTF